MLIHVKSHITCKQCGDIFAGKREFTKHMKIHKPRKRHLCGFCNKEFQNRSNKHRHMKVCQVKTDPLNPMLFYPVV